MDLLEGPETGTVTPEATNLLAAAAMAGKINPSLARGTGVPIADAQAAPLSTRFQDNPLAPGYKGPSVAPGDVSANPNVLKGAPPPAPQTAPTPPGWQTMDRTNQPDAAPAPRSVGASASRDLSPPGTFELTTDEMKANRHTAEMEWLNQTNPPGVPDHRELIPGVNPTLAQREQTVQTAREQKSISQQSPEVSEEERALADQHNQTRSDYYKQPDLAGSTVQLRNGLQEAGDKMDAALGEAFANKTAANAQPVVDLADETLASAAGYLTPMATWRRTPKSSTACASTSTIYCRKRTRGRIRSALVRRAC
jgi:hypothetical protein